MDRVPTEDPDAQEEVQESVLEMVEGAGSLEFDYLNLDEPGAYHTFLPNSNIKRWMIQRGYPSSIFRLEHCFRYFIDQLESGEHWDKTNGCMLICDTELEQVLNRSLVHYQNLRPLFMTQVTYAKFITPFVVIEQRYPSWRFHVQPNLYTCIEPIIEDHRDPLIPEELLAIEGNKKEFTYREIIFSIVEHIKVNRDEFCDARDPAVVDCTETVLGDALQVNTFHRCQLAELISKQITPSSLKGICAIKVGKQILKGICPLYNHREHNKLTRSITAKVRDRIQRLEVPSEVKDFISEPYLPF